MKRFLNFVRFVGIFWREMLLANYQVIKLVLSPTLRIRPGFISVPMKAKGDFEVTTLANSITLTPGTISVHIPDDRHAIVVHAIDIGEDPENVRKSIQESLEANILKFTRDAEGNGTPTAKPSAT
ncbi:MAG: Na+/H+ antiporter subunit E [Phycisphaeraceae bacterium]